MSTFVDNMSMMALNAYEILKYYDNIVKDYDNINGRIKTLEEQNELIDYKSAILEEKVIALLDI